LKFKISFILILFVTSCDDIGQGYQWNDQSSTAFSRQYGTKGYDYGWNAAYSPFDEGIIIIGERGPAIIGQKDLWAIKTDSRGIIEWERTFGGNNDDVGYDVISTSDGGFLFVGHTWSFGNKQQVYAIKTDINGNLNWEKTYGGSMWDVGNAVIELANGGYIIAGYSNSPNISSGNTDMFLIKIDQYGELIWQKAYGNRGFPNHEWAYDIIQLPDNGFIVVGSRDRYSNGSLNGLIIRVDKEGNVIWEKELLVEGESSELIYSISQSPDGYYYLCSGNNSILSPEIYYPKVIKMDNSGNIDWQRSLNSSSKFYHQFRAVATRSGEIIVVGSSVQSLAGTYNEDAFMTKLDPRGEILWTYPYGTADEDDWGWAVFETPKRNIIFVGSTKSFGASLFDIYLVGTNAKGISN